MHCQTGEVPVGAVVSLCFQGKWSTNLGACQKLFDERQAITIPSGTDYSIAATIDDSNTKSVNETSETGQSTTKTDNSSSIESPKTTTGNAASVITFPAPSVKADIVVPAISYGNTEHTSNVSKRIDETVEVGLNLEKNNTAIVESNETPILDQKIFGQESISSDKGSSAGGYSELISEGNVNLHTKMDTNSMGASGMEPENADSSKNRDQEIKQEHVIVGDKEADADLMKGGDTVTSAAEVAAAIKDVLLANGTIKSSSVLKLSEATISYQSSTALKI